MKNFVTNNRKFWSKIDIKKGGRKLLIEESRHVAITHVNAIFAMVLNQARGYNPVWLNDGVNCLNDPLLESYFPDTQILKTKKRPLYKKIHAVLVALVYFLKIYFSKDIIRFHYDGIKYGDILYDTYLFLYSKATIKKVNLRLVRIIASIILRHKEIKNILKSDDYVGVMVSHQVGIDGGVLLRVAIHYGYVGYLSAGQFQLECFTRLDEVYDYEFKAFPKDVDTIMQRLGTRLDDTFLRVMNKQMSGKGDWDGANAFSSDNIFFANRENFNTYYNLDKNHKNVFIMLHVFNDHPHSHFRWMIFKDFYDWMFQTFEFAKENTNVNWIFKQHPSAKFYPTVDLSLTELFKDCPSHIVFIDEDNQMDSRSLMYCADLVVTCLGSAGFEFPAIAGIPSLTASDNFYTGLGFAREPKTKNEYFDYLTSADTIEVLSPQLQLRAKAAYLHIYQFSRVSLLAAPHLSLGEEKDGDIQSWYWGRVIKNYNENREMIFFELDNLVRVVSQPNFKRFNGLDAYCKENNI